jgi:hypothetical protein
MSPHLLVLACLFLATSANACQLEYSDWLIGVFRQQGHTLAQVAGQYASLDVCENARQRAIAESGDPSLANHMRCTGCAAALQPGAGPGHTVSAKPPATPLPFPKDSPAGQAFQHDREALSQALKGGGQTATGLGYKGTGNNTALSIKPAAPPAGAPADPQPTVARAHARMTELRARLTGLQTLLRQFGRDLANDAAAFDNWGATVDGASRQVLRDSREYLLGLFLKYNLLGGLKGVQKVSFDRVNGLVSSPDPGLRAWLGRELGGRRLDAGRLEKLVALGQAEGDFAALLEQDDEVARNLDTMILLSDLLDIVGTKVPGGEAFQHAKMIGSVYADLAAIGYGWLSIHRLERHSSRLAVEVDSLSHRLRQTQQEIDCLRTCPAEALAPCLDRCAGRTRLASPPPLPR